MEYGYNLKITNRFEERFIQKGKQLTETNQKEIYNGLDKLIGIDGDISGSKIQSEWFPQIEVDIFLSHSHNDEEIAYGLVGWLKEKFNLNVFIDSNVWKSADELLKIIDNKHCKTGDYYDYDRRNLSTSHVHMALAVSLAKMLKRSKALFLLNTPNVIKTVGTIEKTDSPWIYFELVIADLLKEKELLKKSASVTESFERMPISHEVSTDNLFQLDNESLEKWEKSWFESFYIDGLSGLMGSKKKIKSPLEILFEMVQKKSIKN